MIVGAWSESKFIESETLCRIYYLDLVRLKIVRCKNLVSWIHNQENLVHDGLKVDQNHILKCGQFLRDKK